MTLTIDQMHLRQVALYATILLTTTVSARSQLRLVYNPVTRLTRSETCERDWYGTGPFCNGECPEGWEEIFRYRRLYPSCLAPVDSYEVVVTGCAGYGHVCLLGSKALCQKSCIEEED
jgi:hypothetical protein